PARGSENGGERPAERHPTDDEPFSALAFKIMADPYVGKLTYFRVYSGQLEAGSRILNVSTGRTERIGRILMMHANDREEVKEVFAGDIAAAVGIKQVATGDTLAAPDRPIKLETIVFPEPVIKVAIEPRTKADQEKMSVALGRLAEEDPTFQVQTNEETGQTEISGMGELHLEVLVDRMLREFKVEANVGRPQVSYRETIRGRAERVEGDVTLTDGKYHDTDSSEIAFRVAGSLALRAAVQRAKPVLLEPVFAVEVVTPEEFMGDVIGDLNRRRGQVSGMEQRGNAQVVTGHVPLAEMFGYATDLRSNTQGRATYTMQFERYDEVPPNIAEKVVGDQQAAAA